MAFSPLLPMPLLIPIKNLNEIVKSAHGTQHQTTHRQPGDGAPTVVEEISDQEASDYGGSQLESHPTIDTEGHYKGIRLLFTGFFQRGAVVARGERGGQVCSDRECQPSMKTSSSMPNPEVPASLNTRLVLDVIGILQSQRGTNKGLRASF